MQTRRRTRATAATPTPTKATGGGGGDTDAAMSDAGAPATGTLHIELPPDVDADALGALLPDFDFVNVNEDSVVVLYRLILAQVADADHALREVEDVRAELERKEVELDQALQDRETAVKELEGNFEKLQDELQQVKQERDQLVTSQTQLQTQLHSFSSSTATSSTEIEGLRIRVQDVEREKRDLIGVVDRLKEDGTQRDEEVNTLRNNLKQARQEQQQLEAQLREIRSNETSTKFKLDSLTQQLELAQNEATRTASELSTKSEEFAKYRRARHAELAQLHATHDALVQTHNATEGTLKALQSAHATQSHQLTQALARVQDLTGQLAEQEATYSSEASALRRLVGMMEEREAQAKAIVEGIESQWSEVGERAERRERALKEDVERETRRADEAERRLEHLQRVMQKVDMGELPLPPGTPARVGGDVLTQGIAGLSPTVAMASRAQRTGRTFTEVYADYVKVQDELAKRNAEFDHMERTLGAVLAQIEERAPLLAQQRAEYERLQSEASQLATQLSQALGDRDAHASAAQEASQKLTKATRENELLQKQLGDLGRQVQALLRDAGRRDDPTIPPDAELVAEGSGVRPAENIEEVITNNLVLFVSIPQLQEQNQKLLRIVRELGAKMENEEKEYREAMENEQLEAVREAHEAIQELEGRLEIQRKAHEAAVAAYAKERDTLRTMLTRAGQVPPAPATVGTLENGSAGEEQMEVAREIGEIQSQFEVYKTETSVDSRRLREDAANAQREAAQLNAQLAKSNAKVEYLNERIRMAQEQNTIQGRELDNLTKRNQQLYDQYTRLDIECNRATEDALVANSAVEQLRNECANLRAEKKIWASVQSRLVEENKTLAAERAHLSDLMANVQRMHGDLERAGENDRRRLEAQVQMLEGQTQDLRTQLSQERDTLRHLRLQKDIEIREFQNKQEKISQEHAKTRELLVGAETSRKHLEIRVEELNKHLQGNEEKLAVYERRSGASNVSHTTVDSGNLESEVAELRAALKITEVDLANARANVQQFQEISQANETALASLSNTHDEYRAATEAQIARLESDLAALKTQLEVAQHELQRSNETHMELTRKYEADHAAWASDKKTLEETIVDLSTSDKQSESDRASWEASIREQEERAKAAEERYSREVVAHADSIKAVADLRVQLTAANDASRTNAATAETAQAKLAASEVSWRQQKDALEKEVSDLNTRCKDLAGQNAILHSHLESVSSQAARIRQAADASTAIPSETDSTADVDAKLAELRSVVAYLRKEKEIVDLQLELAKQENVRLKSQIEHLTQTLEETRETLSQERERAVEAAASEAQHAELVERINQLALLRESNQTLRVDCENHAKRARDLDAKIKELSAELEPAKEKARIAEAELEARDAQIKRLERESATWQERNRQLLTKYDRIDPAEVQQLKEEIEKLQSEKQAQETVAEQVAALTQKTEAQEKTIAKFKETGVRNNSIFQQRMKRAADEAAELNRTVDELRTQLATITTERDALKAQIISGGSTDSVALLTSQVEALTQEKANLEKALAEAKAVSAVVSASEPNTELESVVNALREERDRLVAEKVTWSAAQNGDDATSALKTVWEAEKAALEKARDEALAAAEKAQQGQRRLTEMATRLTQARKTDAEKAAAHEEAAVAAAVAKATAESGAVVPDSTELAKKHAEELAALEARLNSKHEEELKAAATSVPSSGTDGTASEDQAAAIQAAIAAREAELKAAQADDIAAAVERGRMETAAKMKVKETQLARVQARLKALEADIAGWKAAGLIPADQPTTTPAVVTTTPAPATKPAPGVPATTTAAKPVVLPAKPAPAAPPVRKQSSAGVPAGAPTPLTAPAQTAAAPTSAVPAAAATAGAARGGRGGARGGAAARGARGGARALNIKGSAPAATAAAAAAAAENNASAPTAGVSIMGAAGKRAREDGDGSADDSLAKRIKPDGAAPAPGRPVQLKRDRVSNAPPPTS